MVINPEGNPSGSGSPALDDDVLQGSTCPAAVPSKSETEGEMLVVGRPLVPEELLRSDEVAGLLHTLQGDRLLKGCRLRGDLWHAFLDRLPVVWTSVEVAGDHALEIVGGCVAVGGVTKAEARCATKVVVHVDLEVARPAAVTLPSLDVLLADTLAVLWVALGAISKTALNHALAGLAARV